MAISYLEDFFNTRNSSIFKPVLIKCVLGHRFVYKILTEPSSCSECHNFIWGIRGQQCKLCFKLCHSKCLESIVTKCTLENGLREKILVPSDMNKQHKFESKYFTKLTYCSHCGAILQGLFHDQGVECLNENCDMKVHQDCIQYVPMFNCGQHRTKETEGPLAKMTSKFAKMLKDAISKPDVVVRPINQLQNQQPDYQLLSCISSGYTSKVYLAKHPANSNSLKVIKVIKKSTAGENIDYITTEHNIMTKSTCPFLAQLLCSFQNHERLFFVMDYHGKNLHYHLTKARRFSERICQFYAAEIVVALKYLHSHNLIHRDLKLENVLVDEYGHIKLIDFGFSKQISDQDERTISFVGTPNYMSPEMITGDPHSFPVDWWALGILIYELLIGESPYDEDSQDLYSEILTYNFKSTIMSLKQTFSHESSSLLVELLEKDPSKRLGDDMIEHHSFFHNIYWKDAASRRLKPEFRPSKETCPPNVTEAVSLSPITTKELEGITDDVFRCFDFDQNNNHDS